MNLINLIKNRVMKNGDENCRGQLNMFINPYSYLILRNEPDLIIAASRVGIDGQLLAKILSIFWWKKIDRVSFDMTSMAPIVFNAAAEMKKRIYFIGSTTENLDRAIEVITGKYPDLIVCGARNGYFSNNEERETALMNIVKSGAEVLICGMGTPHQERFLCDLANAGWTGAGYTCGGFLHQTAKKGEVYYPLWMDRLHLRWAYRIFDEPKLAGRYLFRYPLAIFLIIKDCIGIGKIEIY